MIQIAKLSQIEEILAITKACGEQLREQGIYQWNEIYPNLDIFRKDSIRQELYIYSEDNLVLGCMVISTNMDKEYENVKWLSKNSKHYYIHRLAVNPAHQGKGIARKMMDFAENLGANNNINSIRLDTFSKNFHNQKFYEARNYKRLGNIFFPSQSDFPFYCYELELPKN